jgi:iron(III) transport system substrate-binding protein
MAVPSFRRLPLLGLAVALVALLAVACGGDDDDGAGNGDSITVYSGRSEALVQPIIDDFQKETGITVNVKYGDTSELAALLLEEGSKTPADVYFAQDAGALGAVADEGLLADLPEDILGKVDAKYRADNGQWVGISGRARVIAFNPEQLEEDEVPDSVLDLTAAEWKGKIGWAPTNASFQAFVTALRTLEGEGAAKKWLEDMKANGTREYANNREIVSAVASGEIELGLVNHYYLWGFVKDQGEGFNARNHYTAPNDPGSLVNVAGVAILKDAKHPDTAQKLVEFLLSNEAQHYFAEETFEYPLVQGVSPDEHIKPLAEIDPPDLDLSNLDDLKGTLELLRSTGVLQ